MSIQHSAVSIQPRNIFLIPLRKPLKRGGKE